MSEHLKSEDAAEKTMVEMWQCRKCKKCKYDEASARFCCADSFPCECGGRANNYYISCNECQKKKDRDKWLSKEIKDWDGEEPLNVDDKYFFSIDDVYDYLADIFPSLEAIDLESLEFEICEPTVSPGFDMNEFLCDVVAEDGEAFLDADEINKAVNGWIDERSPFSWTPSKYRPSIESLRKYLGNDYK